MPDLGGQGHWKKELKDAVEDAWSESKKNNSGETILKVEIHVKGNNPLSGYRVILTPPG
jgi:hypothetical protein